MEGSIAPKTNSLFLMIGPPPSMPTSPFCVACVFTEPLVDWYCFQLPSRPDGWVYAKAEPLRVFVPLLVTKFTTPPVAWPNSAPYPPVLTWISWMRSYGVALPSEPKMIEYDPNPPYPVFVTFAPSITYWFSRPVPPEIDGFWVPSVPELLTPGVR